MQDYKLIVKIIQRNIWNLLIVISVLFLLTLDNNNVNDKWYKSHLLISGSFWTLVYLECLVTIVRTWTRYFKIIEKEYDEN